MKKNKNTLYLIGTVIGALLVLLAVPLGRLFMSIYLWASGGMDSQLLGLLTQSAVGSFQIVGGVLMGLSGGMYLLKGNS